jgi:hypothetical protein
MKLFLTVVFAISVGLASGQTVDARITKILNDIDTVYIAIGDSAAVHGIVNRCDSMFANKPLRPLTIESYLPDTNLTRSLVILQVREQVSDSVAKFHLSVFQPGKNARVVPTNRGGFLKRNNGMKELVSIEMNPRHARTKYCSFYIKSLENTTLKYSEFSSEFMNKKYENGIFRRGTINKVFFRQSQLPTKFASSGKINRAVRMGKVLADKDFDTSTDELEEGALVADAFYSFDKDSNPVLVYSLYSAGEGLVYIKRGPRPESKKPMFSEEDLLLLNKVFD